MVTNFIHHQVVLHGRKARAWLEENNITFTKNGNIFSVPLDIPEIKCYLRNDRRWKLKRLFLQDSKAFPRVKILIWKNLPLQRTFCLIQGKILELFASPIMGDERDCK